MLCNAKSTNNDWNENTRSVLGLSLHCRNFTKIEVSNVPSVRTENFISQNSTAYNLNLTSLTLLVKLTDEDIANIAQMFPNISILQVNVTEVDPFIVANCVGDLKNITTFCFLSENCTLVYDLVIRVETAQQLVKLKPLEFDITSFSPTYPAGDFELEEVYISHRIPRGNTNFDSMVSMKFLGPALDKTELLHFCEANPQLTAVEFYRVSAKTLIEALTRLPNLVEVSVSRIHGFVSVREICEVVTHLESMKIENALNLDTYDKRVLEPEVNNIQNLVYIDVNFESKKVPRGLLLQLFSNINMSKIALRKYYLESEEVEGLMELDPGNQKSLKTLQLITLQVQEGLAANGQTQLAAVGQVLAKKVASTPSLEHVDVSSATAGVDLLQPGSLLPLLMASLKL